MNLVLLYMLLLSDDPFDFVMKFETDRWYLHVGANQPLTAVYLYFLKGEIVTDGYVHGLRSFLCFVLLCLYDPLVHFSYI